MPGSFLDTIFVNSFNKNSTKTLDNSTKTQHKL